MSESIFTASYTGIGEMLRAPWMLADMVKRAKIVQAYAQATAPVSATGNDEDPAGTYKDHFEIVPVERGGSRLNRAEALVVNDDPAAVFVEYGTINQEGHHTLLKALGILGAVH